MVTKEAIAEKAAKAIFGKPLVTNVYRSVVSEAIVASALTDWMWCSEDYASFDFIHPDGTRLEVKQSAVRQSWVTSKPPRPSWDIKPRTGYWKDGITWVPEPGRNADVYILCLHPVEDDTADHRDPAQWQFVVVAARDLPATQRIGLAAALRINKSVGFCELNEVVEALRTELTAHQRLVCNV